MIGRNVRPFSCSRMNAFPSLAYSHDRSGCISGCTASYQAITGGLMTKYHCLAVIYKIMRLQVFHIVHLRNKANARGVVASLI
jgi:hypothetical protein